MGRNISLARVQDLEQTFITYVDTESSREAGDVIGLSYVGVLARVKCYEDYIGKQLFERVVTGGQRKKWIINEDGRAEYERLMHEKYHADDSGKIYICKFCGGVNHAG